MDRMWKKFLSSMNQPSFLGPEDISQEKKEMLETFLLDEGAVDIPPLTTKVPGSVSTRRPRGTFVTSWLNPFPYHQAWISKKILERTYEGLVSGCGSRQVSDAHISAGSSESNCPIPISTVDNELLDVMKPYTKFYVDQVQYELPIST